VSATVIWLRPAILHRSFSGGHSEHRGSVMDSAGEDWYQSTEGEPNNWPSHLAVTFLVSATSGVPLHG
jgi:hypothetical protein